MKTTIQKYIEKHHEWKDYLNILESSLTAEDPLVNHWKDEHRHKLIVYYATPHPTLKKHFERYIEKQPIKKILFKQWLSLYTIDEIQTLHVNGCTDVHLIHYLMEERGQNLKEWIHQLNVVRLIELIPWIHKDDDIQLLADVLMQHFKPETSSEYSSISRFCKIKNQLYSHDPKILKHIFYTSSREEQMIWLFKNQEWNQPFWIDCALHVLEMESKHRRLSEHFLKVHQEKLKHIKLSMLSVFRLLPTYKRVSVHNLNDVYAIPKEYFITFQNSGNIDDLLNDWKNLAYSSQMVTNQQEIDLTL